MDEDIVVNSDTSLAADSFATDVARYFKVLLESNFQGSQLPARQITNHRIKGLQARLYIDEHPQLHKNMYKNLITGFAQDTFVLSQNKYVSPGDEHLEKMLHRAGDGIDESLSASVAQSLVRLADTYISLHTEYSVNNFQSLQQAIRDALLAQVVVPLFREAQRTTKASVTVSPELQHEAVEVLYSTVSPSLEQIFHEYISNECSYEYLEKGVQEAVSVDVLSVGFRSFVSEATTLDAYQQVYQLHRNNQALATTHLYMNFCELRIGEYSFPLFYTPIKTTHAYPSVTCTFDPQIFVNTTALDFVIKEYGHMAGLDEVITGEFDPVFTVTAKNRKDVLSWLQQVVDVVADTFDFDQDMNLENTGLQAVTNVGVTLNNRLQLALFDSPNESVATDYEAFLNDTESAQTFHEVVSGYVMDEPLRFVQEVAEEWKQLPIAEKLISTNPIPLNDEQKQALIATKKPDCAVTVVRGASGTGKTHFASALVAESFVGGSSTLVLSDTAAARDQIARQVTKTLADVRDGMDYHSPVLRLDTLSEEQLADVEKQFIDSLKATHAKYETMQAELRAAKSRKVKDSAESINTFIQEAENVNLHEVEQMVNNETKFGGREWVMGEPIEELGSDLQKLHQAVQYIRTSDANYLLPYIESSQQDAIAEFIAIIREYEQANKAVNQRLPEFIIRYRKLLPDQKKKLQHSLSYVHSNYRHFVKMLANDSITSALEITDNTTFRAVSSKKTLVSRLVDVAKTAKKYVPNEKVRANAVINELLAYDVAPEEAAVAINNYIEQVESLKSKIFGFSGRTLVVENLTRQLRKAIPQFTIEEPEKRLDELQQMVHLMEYIIEQLAQMGLDLSNWKQVLHILKADPNHTKELQTMIDALEAPATYEFMGAHRIYEADNLLANVSLLEQASELNRVYTEHRSLSKLFGIKTIGQVLAQPQAYTSRFNKLATDLEDVKQLDSSKKVIKQFIKTWPDVIKRLGVNYSGGTLSIIDEVFANSSSDDVKDYLSFKRKEQDVTTYFREMITDNYARSMTELRQMTATQTSYSLDAKFLKYIETNAATFMAIKTTLKNKQRLTLSQFKGLQSVYPCIVASVNDYATYLPLKAGIFDTLIIDEASRVSIAEVLPAIVRSKKLVVLGDEQQFSHPKLQSIHLPLNDLFRRRIESAFLRGLGDVPADTKNKYLKRLRDNFDVSKSVLAFSESIANMDVTFRNYFQAPCELVGYVNKHYYGDSLRCLRARALPLEDTVLFTYVTYDTDDHIGLRTNLPEVKQLLAVLNDLKETGYEGTIGIVTPFYEQAALIQRELDESVINDWFERRNLKVMTFDTAQGESRDYVLYSMVATSEYDQLSSLVPADLEHMHHDAAQRINVGFTRARSTVQFVLSKPINQFKGILGELLRQYESLAASGAAKSPAATTDILLAADSLLPHYFYSTKFYKKHSEKVRLITQFSLGEYIKALVPKYKHPAYKVDFLVTLGNERIIITFDELKEHFLAHESKETISYLTADELYAQKILEGYGYRILKLNRFNLGPRPIETLDRLLNESIKHVSWPRDNGFLAR